MSKLAYRVGLEIPAMKVSCLHFSPCGTKLAAGLDDGNVYVWDAFTGNQYYPTLTSPRIMTSTSVAGPSVVIWLDGVSFLCGFSDGYLVTCTLQEASENHSNAPSHTAPKYRLHILRRQATDERIRHLAYNTEMSCVAISGAQKIRLWNRKGLLDWEHRRTLKKPSSLEERKSLPLEITSISWLSNSDDATLLITSYLHNGIVIWDVDKAEALRSINAGGIIFGGVWCTEVQKFVAVNGLRKVDVYDLDSGQIWSPELPSNVSTVKPFHRGSGFVAGCFTGRTELVDISECLILQSLQNRASASSIFTTDAEEEDSNVKAVAVHQDLEEENFMIATAYQGKCILWRTETETAAQM